MMESSIYIYDVFRCLTSEIHLSDPDYLRQTYRYINAVAFRQLHFLDGLYRDPNKIGISHFLIVHGNIVVFLISSILLHLPSM